MTASALSSSEVTTTLSVEHQVSPASSKHVVITNDPSPGRVRRRAEDR